MTESDGKLFDRHLYGLRRKRAAGSWTEFDFLKREAQKRIGECLGDINRTFPLALDLGCHAGGMLEALAGKGGIERLVTSDFTHEFTPQVICDEEFLPFADNSFDLIVSALSLHHVNDLPGTLVQAKRALKPDGLFLAILPGASTLRELRTSIIGASAEHGFALSPRISPFVEVRDAGGLLMRAGFALPVADSDMLTVDYGDAFTLMGDLRGMGEGNVLLSQRKSFTPRSQLLAIIDHYHRHYMKDGAITASFEFITMTGWKPK